MNTEIQQHPRSLSIFFATEMWERYGFYVVQTLLALYLAIHFQWPDKQVYALVGSFTALTYISPVFGGWIADHLIGQKRATLLGACFLFLSYLSMSYSTSHHFLMSALAGITVGTGLLKSNISSLLGSEYPENSPNRQRGFTIFYMGITTGIILGTLLPSILNTYFGWGISFASAGLGIFIAFLTFYWGIQHFDIQDCHPQKYTLRKSFQAFLLVLLIWFSAFLILYIPEMAETAFIGVTMLSLLYLCYTAYHENRNQTYKTLTIALLCVISAIFFAFYFQMFLSFTLFILRVVAPTLGDMAFPPPYFVAIQSIGMLIVGSYLGRQTAHLTIHQQGVKAAHKFLLAMLITMLAFACIAYAAHMSLTTQTLISPLCIIPTYLLFSVAELLLSPTGLCAVTLLASRKKVSTMMGIFFVSLGSGGFLGGKLAEFTAIPLDQMQDLAIIKAYYAQSFLQLFKLSCGAVLLSLGLNYCIQRLMSIRI